MSPAPGDPFPPESLKLLAARITLLTQPIQQRLGSWKIHPTRHGAILVVSQCGLGDAGFLPQVLRDGGLELHRLGPSGTLKEEYPDGSILIGEIRWPVDEEGGAPILVPASEFSLRSEDAQPQSFSILVHAFVQTKRLASARFSKDIQRLLDEVQTRLSCKWWQGLPNRDERTAMNIHLSTKEGEPLTPYEFERRVMPILKQVARIGDQDGLLVRFDNPSTNFVVYCAEQELLVAKGLLCPGGYEHPS